MPFTQILVEATSPLINYDSSWKTGFSASDSSTDQYSKASFAATEVANSQLSFTFDGFAATVVGAKRVNHGRYQVTVDGSGGTTITGDGRGNQQFNQTLSNWVGQQGRHTLTLLNSDPGNQVFLDLDYLAFTTNVGGDGDQLFVETHQETSQAFSFLPSSSWVEPSWNAAFFGGSGLATRDTSAVAKFSFTGDGVTLYGAVGDGYSVSYSVQVDDGIPSTFTPPPSTDKTTHQEIMFAAFGLGQQAHTLTIRLASAPASDQMFSIDYANVYTTSSTGSSTAGVGPETPLEIKIALGITSALAGIFLLFALIVVFGPHYGYHIYVQPRDKGSRPKPILHGPDAVEPETRASAQPLLGYPHPGLAGGGREGSRPNRRIESESTLHQAGSSSSATNVNQSLSALDLLRQEKGKVMAGVPPAYS